MIQRDGNDMQLVCDTCGEEYPQIFTKEEFNQMVNSAKADGWTVKPDSEGGWTHICCEQKGRLAQAQALFGKK